MISSDATSEIAQIGQPLLKLKLLHMDLENINKNLFQR